MNFDKLLQLYKINICCYSILILLNNDHMLAIKSKFDIFITLAHKNIKKNDFLKVYIPPITILACATFFLPNAKIGIGVSSTLTFAKIVSLKNVVKFPCVKTVYIKEGMDTKKYNLILNISQTISGPILEELIFRGWLQPLLSKSMTRLFSRANNSLLGPVFTLGMTVSVFSTAIIFGLCHKSLTKWHIIDGIAFGVMSANYGVAVSVIAHMTGNTLLGTLESLFCGDEIKEVKF